MEAFDAVYVDPLFLTDDPHGRSIACIFCHDGDDTTLNRDRAHDGLIADPTERPSEFCTPCHQGESDVYHKSLHFRTQGMFNAVANRSDRDDSTKMTGLKTAFTNHCATCHASCGACHVSRPSSAEGGFLAGHFFKKTPSIAYNCTACHSARVGDDYMGKNEACTPDLHWVPGTMQCSECHSTTEIHGNGKEYENRYTSDPRPMCTDCHDVEDDGNQYHDKHAEPNRDHSGFTGASLTCQVCHSGPYKNCFNCHVGLDDQGLAFFKTDESAMAFKIGRNPLQSVQRPEDYAVLRHVPVARTTFDFYGEDILTQYDSWPTWKYATPHSTHLDTPQMNGCNGCHGNDELFLTVSDVAPDELEANEGVIVNGAPPEIEN